MDLKERFFGKGTQEPGGPPVAKYYEDAASFQLLYPTPLNIDADSLTRYLREYDSELAQATAELVKVPAPPPLPGGSGGPPGLMGLIAWGEHVVKVVGFESPMPVGVLDRCVRVAHYDPELKEAAYQHASHILLFYAGYESDVLEQHVALAASAAAIARFGALVTMNETACTSVPAPALCPHEEDGGNTLQSMRKLPLLFLYAGLVVIEPEGESAIWLRTYGCHVFSLPDLAIRASEDNQGLETFNLFSNILAHLRESGETFLPGDTMKAGDGRHFRLRERNRDEWFLKSEDAGRILVAEPIARDEVNTP
jgi:Domain of unknown function (DUF4261)